MTTTQQVTCKACGEACDRVTPIRNYGLICAACLVILKAGVDPSEGRDRLHKRVSLSTLTYADPMAVIRQWREKEAALMAARPAEATCQCASCGDVYDVRGLSAIESDTVYVQAGEEACFDRDGLLCKSCRTHFETRYGTPRADCHNILDVLYGVHDTDR